MVEWVSSGSERTFDQSAANGRKEPNLTDVAVGLDVCFREPDASAHPARKKRYRHKLSVFFPDLGF